jgi:tetratricopeptide (TPR) repeat protein
MFRLLGLHPGPNFDIFAAAALADTDLAEAERLLDGLLDVHLLDQLTSDRYRFHDLLRQHAQDIVTANEPAAACRQDRTRLLDYYLCNAAAAADLLDPNRRRIPSQPARRSGQQPSFDDYTRALEWLEAEQANLVAAVRLTGELGWDHYTWQLPYLLSRYFFLRGYTDDWLDTHQLALAATRRLGDRLAEAITLTNLGVVCRRLGRFHESLRHEQEALARYRQVGDPQGQTDTLTNLGIAYRRLGRFRDALEYQQQAVSLQAKSSDRRGQAMTLSNLGMVYERLGDYETALDHHHRAIDLAREAGDRPREAMILTSLGMAYERLGDYETALDHHHRAIDLAKQVGDQHVEGHALNNLGCVHARMGQYDVALEEQQQALGLLRRTGSRGDECEALNDIGYTLRHLGRSMDALHHYEHALELARRIGDRYQEARALDGYAATMHRTDPGAARQHWEQALQIFSELQVPEVGLVNRQLAANEPEL